MSIWSTVHEIRAKKYEHSNVDPRKDAPADEVQTAVVMDYVYDDEAHGHAALSDNPESPALTDKEA